MRGTVQHVSGGASPLIEGKVGKWARPTCLNGAESGCLAASVSRGG